MPRAQRGTKQINVTLPLELDRELRKAAATEMRSVSGMVAVILERWREGHVAESAAEPAKSAASA